jgi:hypothetical protein
MGTENEECNIYLRWVNDENGSVPGTWILIGLVEESGAETCWDAVEPESGLRHAPQYDGTPSHEHALAISDRWPDKDGWNNGVKIYGWNCDGCRQSGDGRVHVRYRCTSGCEFDLCGTCWDAAAAWAQAEAVLAFLPRRSLLEPVGTV